MISFTPLGNKVKTVHDPNTCIVCGDPVQLFNSVKGRKLVGFKQIDPTIPDTPVKQRPLFMTGRACNKCISGLDKVIHEQWSE